MRHLVDSIGDKRSFWSTHRRRLPTGLVVAVPAHNEVDSIGACLTSIDMAAGRVDRPVHVVVAADGCADGTAEVAASHPMRFAHLTVMSGSWGRAGAGRAAAVDRGIERSGLPPSQLWLANTDADCVVAGSWLVVQLANSRRYDALTGVVELDPARTSPDLLDAFHRSYRWTGQRHSHVHGANLGVRADAYLEAGGWCRRTVIGEDHELWRRLVSSGRPVVQTTRLKVVTSSRTVGRVEGGFADDLARLVDRPAVALDR